MVELKEEDPSLGQAPKTDRSKKGGYVTAGDGSDPQPTESARPTEINIIQKQQTQNLTSH